MKNFKVMLSVFMVIIIVLVSVTPSLAVVAPEDSFSGVLQSQNKIDVLLVEKMSTASDKELIPVWIWMTEPDLSDVESMVQKQTGLTKSDLEVITNTTSDELSSALELASMKNTENELKNLSDELKNYLDETQEARAIENEKTNIYLRAKRNITSKMYIENNAHIISSMGIDDSNIKFQSQLTPSIIANLTKSEITNISKNNSVVMIGYFENEELDEPLTEGEMDTMQIDAIKYQYPYTGNNVNVLVYEKAYVRDDFSSFDNRIRDRQKIKIVANKCADFTPSDYEVMIGTERIDHAINTAGILQDCAIGTNIYSVAGNRWEDLEWALQTLDISIINASTNMGVPYYYNSTYGSLWFDSLVNTYDVTLVASAGNGIESSTRILAPACSYNSIAVGAYISNGNSTNDQMRNYKYGPTTGSDLPCYKPDVVIAAHNTSSAAPILSGIVAMIMEAKPSLKSHPEVIKAIIMASCHRKVKSTEGTFTEKISDGLTQKQGAGAVDAYRALKIAIEGTYGEITTIASSESTAKRFEISNNDDVNVSIAWFKENTYIKKDQPTGDDIPGLYDITLADLQELELKVYRGSNIVASSAKTNTAKQMIYLENVLPNTTYRIAVKKNSANNKSVTYGYAYSSKNYELAEISMSGREYVNQTLTTDLSYIDGKTTTGNEIYTWKRSEDGTTWNTIVNATTTSYTLTEAEQGCYVRCEVTLLDNTLSDATTVFAQTNSKVLRYGDVDNDGVITIMDATLIQQYCADKITFTDEQLLTADVDADGYVSNIDATYILQYVANQISIFPIEE